jgi:hypothetical protein
LIDYVVTTAALSRRLQVALSLCIINEKNKKIGDWRGKTRGNDEIARSVAGRE